MTPAAAEPLTKVAVTVRRSTARDSNPKLADARPVVLVAC
jgi:hypothetical protein